MDLSTYINNIGSTKFAEEHGICRTLAWRFATLRSIPRAPLARKIVKETKGLVTYEEIFEPFFQKQLMLKKKRK